MRGAAVIATSMTSWLANEVRINYNSILWNFAFGNAYERLPVSHRTQPPDVPARGRVQKAGASARSRTSGPGEAHAGSIRYQGEAGIRDGSALISMRAQSYVTAKHGST